ncbi:presenilins-associated rhomboid-like protein, mitochondrial isoform X2 [Clupea harengus]|uniref:Presenilins-associated rhomboid-like protein, mitochondrial isoform X2 n=1 Tax=Clupea harengus TaxID=7950 RepID=A0A6P8EHJ3_CLUHA|nr:presenilins-associated rhomboid-like protein, mitochondrial isoform X2 [Clupea harengus]
MACWGYLNKWTKVKFIAHTSVLSPSKRIVLHPQQRCAFRKVQRKPEARKGVQEETGSPPGEMAEARLSQKPAPEPPLPPQMPPRNPRRLIKPLMFTIGFTGCSFGTAAILQYESVKSRLDSLLEESESEKKEKFQTHDTAHWHKWWNQLTDFQRQVIMFMSMVDDMWSGMSEGQRVATGIIAVNAAVLCCWRIPSLQRSMLKYFTSNPASRRSSTTGRSSADRAWDSCSMAATGTVCYEDSLPSNGPLLLQPLFHHSHGGEHVRALDLLHHHCLHTREGAVPGLLRIRRCHFHNDKLHLQNGIGTPAPLSWSFWSHHDSSGCCLHKDARG